MERADSKFGQYQADLVGDEHCGEFIEDFSHFSEKGDIVPKVFFWYSDLTKLVEGFTFFDGSLEYLKNSC